MATMTLLERIEKLNAIGVSLSAEKDPARLVEMILLGAKELTNADGGTIYTVTEDRRLKFEIIRTSSLGFAMGGTSGVEIPFPPIPLDDDQGRPNMKMVVTCAALTGEVINIPDAYSAEGFDFSGTRRFDEKTGYRSRSFLTVPMRNHEETIIGVLQLLNAVDAETGEVVPFSDEDQRLVASLASQASVAMTNNRLIEDQKRLFDSFIHLIASAIDDKSPYTGGHCRRVPVLTMMLAEAATRQQEGELAPFSLNDEQRYELEIAAWLHDCGKIITPEHVVDKATKLEKIFDRIHLVEARFEILRRDLELASATGTISARECAEGLARLEDDRDFLRRSNTGGEFMPPPEQERVRAMAKSYHWRDASGESHPLLSAEEVENLTISRGTLTDAERQIINNHIVTTIKMLESLPFPKHLQQVPEFAGGHHEKMDGSGYPRGLTRDQMSVQARIMAIADIFEALTACDRPYKKAKTLSESLKIMGFMKKDGHIDPDLFEIFVHSGAYLEYARRHLKPEQIDEVDLSAIPGLSPPLTKGMSPGS
ncbi:MAG: phosphohydrolase [Desulfuromonas sp.]|nr:MAG: phosphohydrolase [Desulfuromonas sp.]